jgi:hypothetical protein
MSPKIIKALVMSAIAAVVVFTTASAADNPTPFIGVWVLDMQKSTFQPGPADIKSQTVTVTAAPGGAVHSVIASVGTDGKNYRVEYTTLSDGKPAPTTGDPDDDSVAITKVNEHVSNQVWMKDGKTTGQGTLTISKDDKIFTAALHGTAGDGTKWKNTFVYNRQ